MIRQLRPADLTATSFQQHWAQFQAGLRAVAPRTYWRNWKLSFLPGLISQETHRRLLDSVDLLLEASKAVLDAYPHDLRIQHIFSLSPELHELTLKASRRPFHFHTARPDFLIDLERRPRFCEINCRFPANGFMNSIQMSKVANATYGMPVPFGIEPDAMLGPDQGLLALVQESEVGDEIWDLVSGRPMVAIHPGGLHLVAGQIHAGSHPVSAILTELDRSEFLHFAPEVRDRLAGSDILLNDLRCQLLLHDKRLLAVLWDEGIMADLMEADAYRQLRPNLIPSYRPDDPEIFEDLKANPQRWIMKPASGGRGRGTLVGKAAPRDAWEKAIDRNRLFLAQAYVEQSTFDIIIGLKDDQIEAEPMNVVGCVPTLSGKALGAGLLRASQDLLVNVSGGRAFMFGCCLEG